MNTFKTAIVVVALLIVLYGVYTALNKPPAGPPAEQPFAMEGGIVTDSEAPFVPDGSGSSNLEEFTPPPVAISGLSEEGDVPTDPYASPGGEFTGMQPYEPGSGGDFGNEFNQGQPGQGPPSELEPETLGANSSLSPEESFQQDPGAMTAQPVPDDEYARMADQEFQAAWNNSLKDLQSGNYRRALATLSFYYKSPYLTPEQNQQLLDLLDPLAGKVIYSREHLLFPAYVVGGGDTLKSIAEAHRVPAQLLANINGVSVDAQLQPGTELKVVRGPFSAEVDTEELTLFVGELYAGRFPITVGNNPAPQPTVYQVRSKQPGKEFVSGTTTVPARHPENPYGDYWIELGGGVGLHEQNATSPAAQAGLGCIGLQPQHAVDVANILSIGSEVTVR